jgi:hypothetical protein
VPPTVKGAVSVIPLASSSLTATDIRVEGPPGWTITTDAAEAGRINVTVAVPETTKAREARVRISSDAGPQAELYLGIPLAGRLQTVVRPVPDAGDGSPGVMISIQNSGPQAEDVSWSLQLTKMLPMTDGTFNLSASQSPEAYFAAPADGVVQIPGRGRFCETVPLADVDRKLIYAVRASVSDHEGRFLEVERYIGGFARVARAAGSVTLDGVLNEADWGRTSVQHIDQERQFYRFKKYPNCDWTGAKDLSGQVRFLWDAEYLYIGAQVTDDSYNNPGQDGSIWCQDGLQFLVDPARADVVKQGKYDYIAAVGQKGPQAWCALSANTGLAPGGDVPEIKVAARRAQDGTGGITYEVAIPWARVTPFQPAPGANLGLSLILNEDDGQGRDSFMGWFGGVHSKQLDLVGDLILED